MRGLTRNAQIYIVMIYLVGVVAVVLACVRPFVSMTIDPWEVVAFLLLGALVGNRKVPLLRHRSAKEAGNLSLSFTLTFAALLHFGPSIALLVGTVSMLSGCLFPKRQPTHQLLFNLALHAAQTWVAGIFFVAMNGGTLDITPFPSFPAAVVSTLVFFLINTGGVAIVIALCTQQKAARLWTQTFLWTAPSYFIGACVSTLVLLLAGHHLATALLFGAPVAYLTYQSYAIYTSRAQEKQKHIDELSNLYLSTIKSLALAIDAKDQYTHQHILRVQRYAVAIAKHMGLEGDQMDGLSTGALLHDIGKLGVPEYVLLKPGPLSADEFAKIKKHPEIGAAILDPVAFPWPVLPVVKSHHERWDGTGYPEGLSGEAIPLTARILAVADVYDALTSARPYRGAWSHDKALASIRQEANAHFDPVVVAAFMEVIDAIVDEMARQGTGPRMQGVAAAAPLTTKADEAVRDIQRASSELWALYEVAQTLSSSLGLSETLDILARKLEAILPGVACLFLLEDEDQALVVRSCVGVNREFFQECRTVSSASRSARVARGRKTYLGDYDPEDLLVTGSQTTPWVMLQTALILPIVHQGQVLGTINLYHPQRSAFGPHDQQLLEMVADRAATAIYNGLLYDRTRSHAFTDPLTGLYNVRYLAQTLEERCNRANLQANGACPESDEAVVSLDRRAADPFALLYLDLDSFKPINDNFGHQKGDQVLRDLSQIFRGIVRDHDIVARYGGDEFLIVLEGAERPEAEAIANRLQEGVVGYDPGLRHAKLGALRLGVSIGCACFPLDGQDYATLLTLADSQMYRDKTERKLGRLADKGEPAKSPKRRAKQKPSGKTPSARRVLLPARRARDVSRIG